MTKTAKIELVILSVVLITALFYAIGQVLRLSWIFDAMLVAFLSKAVLPVFYLYRKTFSSYSIALIGFAALPFGKLFTILHWPLGNFLHTGGTLAFLVASMLILSDYKRYSFSFSEKVSLFVISISPLLYLAAMIPVVDAFAEFEMIFVVYAIVLISIVYFIISTGFKWDNNITDLVKVIGMHAFLPVVKLFVELIVTGEVMY